MHKFLRSIGFSRLHELENQDLLLKDVLSHYDYKKIAETPEHHTFAEISKEYGSDFGITVCGEYDSDDLFHFEYYYPFFWGTQSASYESIAVDCHMATTSFAGAVDDGRVGMTLIFYVSNAADYIDEIRRGITEDRMNSVSFAALASEGTILLPVQNSQKADIQTDDMIERRNMLFDAAQNGDKEAIRSLTMEDIRVLSDISRRVRSEDIYSIVDSSFMPFGMECDLYSVLGEIMDANSSTNHVTGERVWQLRLNCNDVPLDVCVNEANLLGVPEPGRRFKGSVWLQGRINF
ncbi:MAG: DUF3881 family protein [Bilifractor sp.]|jgi:hypothetical protein